MKAIVFYAWKYIIRSTAYQIFTHNMSKYQCVVICINLQIISIKFCHLGIKRILWAVFSVNYVKHEISINKIQILIR